MRKILFWLSIGIFCLPNISYSLTTYNPIQYYEVVNVSAGDMLNVRKSYNRHSQKVGQIPPYKKCVAHLNKSRKKWVKIHYDGITGWVNSRYLRKTQQCEHSMITKYYDIVRVAYDDVLNVRELHYSKSRKIAEISPNEKCLAYLNESYQNWAMIHHNGITGWVNSRYLKESQCTLVRKNPPKSWRNAFYKYSSTQKVTAPNGFVVKSEPRLQAKTLKDVGALTVINDVAGHLDTHEGRFYMSNWSWQQANQGKEPNWIYFYNSQPQPERKSNQPHSSISTYSNDRSGTRTANKIYITHLSFMDITAGMPLESSIANPINQAVIAGIQLAQQNMPYLKLNESGHQIDNSDENVNEFINLFLDFNLTKSQKIDAIIQKIMASNRIGVIVTGQYLKKSGDTVHVRPLMLSKNNRRIVTKNFIFQDKDFMCSYNALCQEAHEKIRNAVMELLENL